MSAEPSGYPPWFSKNKSLEQWTPGGFTSHRSAPQLGLVVVILYFGTGFLNSQSDTLVTSPSTGPGGFFSPPPGPEPPHTAGQRALSLSGGAPRPLTAQHEEQHTGQGGHDHQQSQPDALPHAARSPLSQRPAPRGCGARWVPKRAGSCNVPSRRSTEQRRGGPWGRRAELTGSCSSAPAGMRRPRRGADYKSQRTPRPSACPRRVMLSPRDGVAAPSLVMAAWEECAPSTALRRQFFLCAEGALRFFHFIIAMLASRCLMCTLQRWFKFHRTCIDMVVITL